MYNVLSITIPFFAIIFLGTTLSYRKIFDDTNAKILTKFALYVTLPPFVFINILKASSNVNLFNWNFILRFEIVTISILFLSFLISKSFFGNDKKKSSMFALNSAYPNYGYMGIPLCILAFGEMASIPISLILLVDTLILLSFTSFFTNDKNNFNFFKRTFIFLFEIIKNPILFSVFLGFIFISSNIKLHSILYNFIEILSFAATPTALFAIGINLYGKFENKSYNDLLAITAFKLFIHPLLIFLIFYIFPSDTPILWIKVAILCASLPVASNVFAMSIYYNSFSKTTSSSIFATTIISTLTVPFVLYLLL